MISVGDMMIRLRDSLANEGLQVTYVKARAWVVRRFSERRYHRHRKHLEALIESRLGEQRDMCNEFSFKPIISIILPVYNVPTAYLAKAIESVLRQSYPCWELCIFDDASTNPETTTFLRNLPWKDERIVVHFGERNQGIVSASNQAISMARGAYVGFLDNDDELTADALFECVALLQDEDYDLVYSDEDKLSTRGRYTEPFFKPDWCPDYLLSCNYVTHFAVYRKSIGDSLGWLRQGYDGSQDYDLVLRFTERTNRVRHIPKVLYHWRKIGGSTAQNAYAKPYAYEAGARALADACERRGFPAKVTSLRPGHYRVKRNVALPFAVTLIVIVSSPERTREFVRDFEQQMRDICHELIMVHTGEASRCLLDGCRTLVRTVTGSNEIEALNEAASIAEGDTLVITRDFIGGLSYESVMALLEHTQRPEVGVVGARMCTGRRIYHAGIITGGGNGFRYVNHGTLRQAPGYFASNYDVRNYSAVAGLCHAIRRDIFLDMGGYNPALVHCGYDVDFCLRARSRGYLIVYTPFAELSIDRSMASHPVLGRNCKRALTVASGVQLDNDPFYNPNLSREKANYSLACDIQF